MARRETKLATLGLAPDIFDGIVNMPVCRASTILFKNLDQFEAGERGEYPLPTYGRYGNPTQIALEKAVAELEGADHAIVFSTGLAAIVAALFAFAKAGDHVLMVDTVYGSTRRFCDYELKRLGVEVTYYDPTIGAGISSLFKENTKVVYVESPGSLSFEMQDIPAISAEAKKRGIIVIADNTWATPLYFKAFEKGVDISMHSATKYIGGHSDMLMGTLTCKKEHYKQLIVTARNLGSSPSADNCFLALRGLRTMTLRLDKHYENSLKVAGWLKTLPQVEEVYYPALPGAPGHELWKRDMAGACGLFAFQMKPVSYEQLSSFIDGLEYFGLGFSWGGFESLIIPCHLNKVRSATTWPHEGPLIRLHIGLEHVDDLIEDLAAGFKRLQGK